MKRRQLTDRQNRLILRKVLVGIAGMHRMISSVDLTLSWNLQQSSIRILVREADRINVKVPRRLRHIFPKHKFTLECLDDGF